MRTHLARWFPTTCILCAASTPRFNLCAACARTLPRAHLSCAGCGLPIAHPGGQCRRCRVAPLPFGRVFSGFLFEAPVSDLIRQAKFSGSLTAAYALGELLADQLALALASSALEEVEALIPVPLHARRLRHRGFNQAQIVAQRVAKRLGTPLRPHWAARKRETLAQTGLSRAARKRNVLGAFWAKPVPGTHVAIIDDVMTTGETAVTLAGALLGAGASRVDAWVVARAEAQRVESVN